MGKRREGCPKVVSGRIAWPPKLYNGRYVDAASRRAAWRRSFGQVRRSQALHTERDTFQDRIKLYQGEVACTPISLREFIMSRDRERKRKKDRKAQVSPAGLLKADCPCPKVKCENHGLCEPCRGKHEKSLPYCERDINEFYCK